MEVEVRGAEEIQKKMAQVVQQLPRGIKTAMGQATLIVMREAITSMRPGTGRVYKRGSIIHRASAPGFPPAVDTGRLRASIRPEVKRMGGEIVGIVGSNVAYAPHLEFGTSRMAARPFLKRAFEKKKREIRNLLDRFITKLVREANR